MKFRVAVVIPFFQRRPGILIGSVRSALNQAGVPDVEVLVVDDCSPIPAAGELAELMEDHADRIRLIQMPRNSGQGAGRNKGLDSVRPDTEYVAFLDSDDEWSPDHLKNALYALDKGYDFYFSDFYQLHQTVTAFQRAKRINLADHPRLGDVANIHIFKGSMFDQIIKGNVLGMSTIVYRFSKFRDVRFRENFRSTGEEYLFWLDLATMTDRMAFSSASECVYGEGVNTYSGASWGSDGAIRKLHDEISYLQEIRDKYPVTRELRRHINSRLADIRVSVIREAIHRFGRRKSVDLKLLTGIAKMDPLSLVLALPISVMVVGDIFRSRLFGPREAA